MPASTPIEFVGAVRCERMDAAINLRLTGETRAPDGTLQPTQLLFCDATAPPLPHRLTAVRLRPLADAQSALYRLESTECSVEFAARSLQSHRDASAAFYAVLPRQQASRGVRLAWGAMLAALRIPGAAQWLARIRSST